MPRERSEYLLSGAEVMKAIRLYTGERVDVKRLTEILAQVRAERPENQHPNMCPDHAALQVWADALRREKGED